MGRETIEQYSKESQPIREIKQPFVDDNDRLLNETLELNRLYLEQEPRTECKNCGDSLGPKLFESFDIPYTICSTCGHLNGMHEDSQEFLDYLYSQGNGDNYKESYINNYDNRVAEIYIPKVDFLTKVVGECRVSDVGCGAGHFLKACEYRGIEGVGIDPNASLIDIGKSQLKFNKIHLADSNEFEGFIESADSVVSMIGVLEHLQEPNKAIEAFKRSNAKYLYISVPLFSLSVAIEHSFPQVFPRHLRGPHTHLYTEQSLRYMIDRYGLRSEGEWWFGSDMMDLYRSLHVLTKDTTFDPILYHKLGAYIDKLQAVLDQEHDCSEVHLILSKE